MINKYANTTLAFSVRQMLFSRKSCLYFCLGYELLEELAQTTLHRLKEINIAMGLFFMIPVI